MTDDLWCVCLDGRPIYRALAKRTAEQQADFLARGLVKHRAYDNRRTGELSIKPDQQTKAQQEQTYRQLKTHTTVSV